MVDEYGRALCFSCKDNSADIDEGGYLYCAACYIAARGLRNGKDEDTLSC